MTNESAGATEAAGEVLRRVLRDRFDVQGFAFARDVFSSTDWVFLPRGGLTKSAGLDFATTVERSYTGPEGKSLLADWAADTKQWSAAAEARARNLVWADLTDQEVMALALAAEEEFLSSFLFMGVEAADDIRSVDEGEFVGRRWFFHQFLWLVDSQRPRLLREALFLDAVGDDAGKECARRMERHVGRWPALLELAKTNPPAAPVALENLRRLVWRHLPAPVRERLERDGATGPTEGPAVIFAEIDGQSFLTGAERLQGCSLAELLVRTIEGRLDVLPRAVANDLVDRVRHTARNPVSKAEPTEDEQGEIRVVVEDAARAGIGREFPEPLSYVDSDSLVQEYRRRHPYLGSAIDAVNGKTDPGVSSRTNAERVARLREYLGAAPRGKGRPTK